VRLELRWLAGLLVILGSGCQSRAQEAVVDTPQATSAASAGEAEAQPEGSARFIRVTETDEGRPKSLETSIVRYEGQPGTPHEGVVVDLVGVVHIGQLEYYQQLKARLANYDVVLYELVAPDGTRIRPEDVKNRNNPLSAMQLGMRDMLNLEFQLEHIDYFAENFRHADMSPEEFMEDMEERGDSLLKMGLRMMGAGLASASSQGGDAGILMAMMAGEDRPKKMKQAMARQLVEMEVVTAGLDDEQGENTLIRGRNMKAFKIMEEELDSGKKRIAVFYGAGHLPDMAERLESEYGMQPGPVEWFSAWDLQRN
jgi:hypothetical protein